MAGKLDEIKSWPAVVSFLIGVVGATTISTTWVYATFVPRNERDQVKADFDRRVTAIENGQKDSLAVLNDLRGGQFELKGKVDSIFVVLQNIGRGK